MPCAVSGSQRRGQGIGGSTSPDDPGGRSRSRETLMGIGGRVREFMVASRRADPQALRRCAQRPWLTRNRSGRDHTRLRRNRSLPSLVSRSICWTSRGAELGLPRRWHLEWCGTEMFIGAAGEPRDRVDGKRPWRTPNRSGGHHTGLRRSRSPPAAGLPLNLLEEPGAEAGTSATFAFRWVRGGEDGRLGWAKSAGPDCSAVS
jgi:hypothetical protein